MKLSKSPVAQAVFPVVSFQDCPAKTWPGPKGHGLTSSDEVCLGRNVQDHCEIVCAVAQELISRLPVKVRELFPKDAAFAAGCHDIGKVSPFFYEKLRRACSVGAENLHPLLGIDDPSMENTWGGHAGVSQLCAEALGAPKWVPQILGNHHGRSPAVSGRTALDEVMGGKPWQDERRKLVQALSDRSGMSWPFVNSNHQARLVSGLATVSDWIGSGHHFEDPGLPWEGKISLAVSDAGFVTPEFRPGLSFEQVFGFAPRSAQSALIDSIKGPGAYLFEAPMGLGKTEAALYAAYRMLETGQASGVYFALPTQLTSNKIQDRFEPFLDKILTGNCKHRSWLLHASSWLMQAEQAEDARPGGAWFSQAKRGLLAPFAVGTIDQALMGVMRVKHGFVRAFGLAGKVVILDEVHTYDAYTGTLLDSLVEMLRALGCTVIILSATLDSRRRKDLLPGVPTSNAYPLVSALPSGALPHQVAVATDSSQAKTVTVKVGVSEDAAMDEALGRAQSGQQVLWIENTVAQAQSRFRQLSARGQNIECGLLHARFTPTDRSRIEDRWVHLFGKTGCEERGASGRILVGTQVLEQSLDLDADFLVSAFAPTDMLLQRMGRLWRHQETPRPSSAKRPEAWLLGPSLSSAVDDPYRAFGGSAFVYAPYVLCRSLKLWLHRNVVTLPGDIRTLVEETYAEQDEPSLERWLREMEKGRPPFRIGREVLRSNAAQALSEYGNVASDESHATRFGDRPSVQWLLLSDLEEMEDDTSRLTFLDGTKVDIPKRKSSLSREKWRAIATAVAKNIVSVPLGSNQRSGATVAQVKRFGIHHVCYLGPPEDQDKVSEVQVAVVTLSGLLSPATSFSSEAPVDRYDRCLGFEVFKKEP